MSAAPASGTPQWCSVAARIWRAITPSCSSDRLRCLRTPRLTCAIASSPRVGVGVEQQPDLHPVARRERQRLQQLAGARVLAAQRLHHARQLGPQRREQRAHQQLGDPAAAGGALDGLEPQRPPVEALHEVHAVLDEQRAEQGGHERGVEVDEVGVEVAQHVAGGGGERPPQDLALAGPRFQLGHDVGAAHHAGPGRRRDLDRAVGRPGVHDHQLVHERPAPAGRSRRRSRRPSPPRPARAARPTRVGRAWPRRAPPRVQGGSCQVRRANQRSVASSTGVSSVGVLRAVQANARDRAGRSPGTHDRRDHVHGTSGGRHLVGAEHAGARRGREGGGGEGALQPVGDLRDAERLADEVLVRQRHQHRPAGGHQLVAVPQQGQAVEGVLAEVVGRVDEDALPRHTARERGAPPGR